MHATSGATWILVAAALLLGAVVACSPGRREARSAHETAPGATAGNGAAPGAPATAPADPPAPALEYETREADSEAPAETAPPRPRRRVVIQGAGDYMLHTRVHASARFHADWPDDPDAAATEGYSYLVYRVKPSLAKGDLNIVNLETPLAVERHAQSGTPAVFNGPPIVAGSLARAGFHVLSLANNHAYDQGIEGVVETRRAVLDAGLLPVGGGAGDGEARAPVFIERSGVRIGILAFTETVNRMTARGATVPDSPRVAIWRDDQDLEIVRAARRQCDILVVAFHWGAEFAMAPNRFQRRTAAALCGEGVDLVLGAHSHTLQEVRRYDAPDESQCVVAYSLGNFLSNQGLKYRAGWANPDPDIHESLPYTRDGALLRVAYEEDPEGRMRLASVQAVPLWTENNWLQRFAVPDFRNDIYVAPLYASMADPERSARYAALYRERLDEIRRALGDEVEIVPE